MKQNSPMIFRIFSKFSKTFWVANTMELFERWAYYGFFMLFANYLTMSTDTGALGLSQTQKGIIMGVGTAILYFLPLITGAIADKIGYKKTLIIAFAVYLTAFIIMPYCRSFLTVFSNYLFLALGAALFKPIVSATVARNTNEETSSIGFGIFYMMVNVGAFIGPVVALQFSESDFQMVFHVSAAVIVVNMIILFFYKEPERKTNNDTLLQAISHILKNIWIALSDLKLVLFLLIAAGFWTMYNQLFFSLPVFIDQWVDTHILYEKLQHALPWLIHSIGSPDGTIKAEYFTDLDALFIIAFQVIVSSMIMKWRPLNSMITGFIISSIGMGLALLTHNAEFLILSIFIFAVGEMAGSPKITEYIGRIAPPDKTALYIGSSFLPIFLGSLLGGVVSGPVYESMADKSHFLKLELLSRHLHYAKGLTQNEVFRKATHDLGMNAQQLNQMLWDKYHPAHMWYVVTAIGLFAAFLLWLYDRFLLKSHLTKA